MKKAIKAIKPTDDFRRRGNASHAVLFCAFVFFVTFVIYLPSINGKFLLDDYSLLFDSQIIKSPAGLYKFWFTTEPIDYWPVTNTTLWIEWRLWGVNPTGYHVTNVFLHIAESLLLWLVLRKLAVPGAFLAALVFAVHPVNVESVAWISSRKNLISLLFFLLSVFCFLKSEETRAPFKKLMSACLADGWYWLSLGAFLLAMLGKGDAAPLPAALLLIIWWKRKIEKRDFARIVPFVLVATLLVGVNIRFQTHGRDILVRDVSFSERLLGAGGVVWFYLYKAFIPLKLIFVYPQWKIDAGNILWYIPSSAVIIVTATLWAFRNSWGRPLLFAWGFFCVALIPVMGFTDVGYMDFSLVADRYQHIAIIAVTALIGAGWERWKQKAKEKTTLIASFTAALLICSLMVLTWRQTTLYRDAETLYTQTLRDNPGSWHTWYNLGSKMAENGRFAEAVEYYKKAVQLNPEYARAYTNLGCTLAFLKQYSEAEKHLQQALQLRPNDPDSYVNLGNVMSDTDRVSEALELYQKAIKIDPNLSEAHQNLGNVFGKQRKMQESIACFRRALEIRPSFPEAHNSLGLALTKTGQTDEAIEEFKKAVQYRPQYVGAWRNLALTYADVSRYGEAVSAAEKALAIALSMGQTSDVVQITESLNAYRSALKKGSSSPPPQPTVPARDSRRAE